MTTPTSPDKPPPEWMLLLEKKKNRPHRLAHEIGAGAPCLTCGEKCPGLDLHFWRKVCRNCKCKKEEHDVKDDDGYEQFEILLGAGNRRKKPGAVLKIKVPDLDVAVSNKQFDWVPPNVSDDVAAEYMQQLPASKLPISGSDGALYRRQQLEKQMPLHDLDAGRCHNLTPQEIEQLQKYLDNLKNNVVGQGRVTKIPGLYLEQRHGYGTTGATVASSTLLPSSRSDQSLHPLPPLPHLYNAVPRPFKPTVCDDGFFEDDLPPPLPDSLPPGFDGSISLRTPGSFNPSGQKHYGVPPTSSQQGLAQNQGNSKSIGAIGSSAVPSQISSNIVNSSKVPGSFFPGQENSAKQSGSSGQHASDGSVIYSGSQLDVANSSAVSGRFFPAGSKLSNQPGSFQGLGAGDGNGSSVGNSAGIDGTSVRTLGQSSVASSSGVGGQFYPGQNQSSGQYENFPQESAMDNSHGKVIDPSGSGVHGGYLEGQSQTWTHPGNYANASYPSDGSVNFSRGETGIANSSGVGGQFYPGQNQNYGQSGSLSNNFGQQNIASSSGVGGKFYPGQNVNYSQSGNVSSNANPQDGSAIHSHGQPNIANSSGVGGKFYPGQNVNYSQSGDVSSNTNPQDGSAIHSHGQPNIANSSGVGGKFYPGQNVNYSQSGDVSSNTNPQDGSAIHSHGQPNIVNSSGVGGKFYPGQNANHGQSGNVSNDMNPHDTSAIHSHDQAGMPHSSGVGQFYTGQNQNHGQPGNLPNATNLTGRNSQQLSDRTVHNHTYSNVTFPDEMASTLSPDQYHSDNPLHVPGDYPPESNNPSQQRGPMQMTGAAGNPMAGGPGNRLHSQNPEPARFEHSSVPLGLASSSDIGGDSMPRSAQVIQQSNVVDNDLASQLENLSAQEQAAGSGLHCRRCTGPLAAGEVAVFADRAGPDAAWHPACFACRTCSELLADLVYFFGRGDVYCGRHYAELLDIPRCRACDELIFVKEYTVAEGMTFHVKHFSCYECDEPLAGKQYVPVDDMPTCLDCYQEIFGKRCATCMLQIPAGHQRVGWKELNWHALPQCFCCAGCSKSLLGGKFVMRENKPYCNKECASENM